MNDYELNHLGYKLALIYDKRTYIQYYCSLLKKKNLIFFTFMPGNDYNLITLKLSLFLLSFSLYFTINCFFFTDKTMHKFYLDYNDFIHQIPPILYSSFISSIINMICVFTYTPQKHDIKYQQNKSRIVLEIKKIINLIIIHFLILIAFLFAIDIFISFLSDKRSFSDKERSFNII